MTKSSIPPALKISLFLAFFLSGANGLVYEIVFRRQLLLSLGVTHYSVGTVLTVFMAGLGLGSIVFGKLADRARDPLLLFSFLEAGTGLFGFLLLSLFPFLDRWYAGLAGSTVTYGSALIPLKACLAGAFLFPPTVLMGGTLPALGKALEGAWRRVGSRIGGEQGTGGLVGLLYGINTLGGVAGIIVVTFWLLGVLGARRTLVFVSALSLCIGALFAVFALQRVYRRNRIAYAGDEAFPGKAALAGPPSKQVTPALVAILVSGFVGLSLEVYWTRVLAYIIGSHGYAFGVMLASFIAGIAIGSLFISWFVDRVSYPQVALGTVLILLGSSLFAVTVALYKLRGLVEHLSALAAGSWDRFITFEMGSVFLILLAPTILLGAVFPLVIAATSNTPKGLGSTVGRAYAFNTLGSILGSFASSFILIPLIGITRGIQLLVVLAVGTGITTVYIAESGRVEKRSNPLWFRFAASLLAAGSVAAAFLIPFGGALQELGNYQRLLFYRESSSATVAVREDGEGQRILSINGLDEVPVDFSSLLTFRMLAHLPLLLHRDPHEVMVISLGGALTTGSVATHPVRRIDAVDLCPPVVDAAAFFEEWNYSVLRDRRLNVILQDGRNYLLTVNKRYDVITADATHPWSADSWILYTREFYELVKTRLSDGGLFCQWVPLHWLSPDDYRCILRTMRSVFPVTSLWLTGSYTVVLAGLDALSIDPVLLAQKMEMESVRADLESVGINSPESLLGLFIMNEEAIERYTGEGVLNTDDLAYLEHSASRCYARETTPENLSTLLRFRERPEWFPVSQELDDLFRAREKLALGRIAMYGGNFERARRFYEYALTIAPNDGLSVKYLEDILCTLAAAASSRGDWLRFAGDKKSALWAYDEALAIDPGEPGAHYGIGLIDLSQGNYDQALAHFDLALERRNKDAKVRAGRASALIAMGMLQEAEREIEEIERLETGSKKRYSGELKKLLRY